MTDQSHITLRFITGIFSLMVIVWYVTDRIERSTDYTPVVIDSTAYYKAQEQIRKIDSTLVIHENKIDSLAHIRASIPKKVAAFTDSTRLLWIKQYSAEHGLHPDGYIR